MGTESENVKRLREAYRAWHECKGCDTSGWLSLFDDAVSLTSIAGGAEGAKFSRPRSSRAEVVDYFKDILDDWDMNYFDMADFVEQDDRVVAIGACSWTHKATGKTAETPKIDIWRFKDGRAVEFSEFYDTARVFGAAS